MTVERDTKTRLVVVLGMHRSGTSAISSAIDELGMNFGDNLYGPREDNPAGFWENEHLVQFNNALLAELGMSWDSFGLIDGDVWADSKWRSWFDSAEKLLFEEFSGASAYGMKDPRLSKLLDFWNQVFIRHGCDVKYVLALRNPLEVMASLNKRDGFDAIKAQLLWFEYTLSALQSTEDKNRLLVSYNDMMEEPNRIIDSLSEFLLDMLEGGGDDVERIVSALNAEYRHTSFTPEDLEKSSDVMGLVVSLYLVMLDYARGMSDEAEFNTKVNKITSCYRLCSPLPIAYEGQLDKNDILLNENSEMRRRGRYQLFMDFIKGRKSV